MQLFKGIFDTEFIDVITPKQFLMCIGVSILIGIIFVIFYRLGGKGSNSFLFTLCLLPAAVCVVIMMVNGNVGAGVAVAGAFSLVRFRSAPGTAREIGSLFLAMGGGLISGMGYLAYALLFCVIMSVFMLIAMKVFSAKDAVQLNITVPEDLNYSGLFDDLFEKYAGSVRMISVKTTNMGSLFKIRYAITLKDKKLEKEFIDELRCRNGNLEVSICEKEDLINEL